MAEEKRQKLLDKRFTILLTLQALILIVLLLVLIAVRTPETSQGSDLHRSVAAKLQAAGLIEEAIAEYEKYLPEMNAKFNQSNGWDNKDTMREAVDRIRNEFIPGRREVMYAHASSIAGAGFKSPSANRPVANISFALNYYFHKDNPLFYHLVNMMVHITTGFLLFLLLKTTSTQPITNCNLLILRRKKKCH